MGVRQRRKPKVGTFPSTESDRSSSSKKKSTKSLTQTNKKKRSIPPWVLLFGIIFYFPVVIIVNPITMPHIFHILTRRPCVGTCVVKHENKTCGPVDTDRVVFVRIPKTASTSIISLFETFATNKSVAIVDLQEMEDLISSIPQIGTSVSRIGYHDPRPKAFPERLKFYYKRASKKIVHPPFKAQDRTFYEGHLYFFNFSKNALNLVGPQSNLVEMLPDWLVRWYHLERPTQEQLDHIEQITMVRKPQDRLASMYYYDRHEARSNAWRETFITHTNRGNSTLEECLLNEKCVEANELRRWCSVQTEMLCGARKECTKQIDKEALEIAKENVERYIIFAGVAERMNESVRLLAKVLPSYIEGADKLDSIPFEKQSKVTRKERIFSEQAQKVLNDICSVDNELYDFVDQLLTERLNICGMSEY